MPVLVWDEPGSRTYETGVDKGVLYLPNGSGVPWNGLTSIVEVSDKSISPIYYDGKKINELVSFGDFSGRMKAITYPDEFIEIEGFSKIINGVFLGEQKPQFFGLCYRTRIGNDLGDELVGYKLHILYNLIAIPTDKEYETMSSEPNAMEFEWNITSIMEDVSGFYPTAHVVINSLDVNPLLLQGLEDILYGSTTTVATLPPMDDLITYIKSWYIIQILNNGDGTWTAISSDDSLIQMLTVDTFEITQVNAVYLDLDTYMVSDT